MLWQYNTGKENSKCHFHQGGGLKNTFHRARPQLGICKINETSFLPCNFQDVKSQVSGLSAHHKGCRAIELTPRCCMRKDTSCRRGSADEMLPPGPDQKSSALYVQLDIIQRDQRYKETTYGGCSRPNNGIKIGRVRLLSPKEVLTTHDQLGF